MGITASAGCGAWLTIAFLLYPPYALDGGNPQRHRCRRARAALPEDMRARFTRLTAIIEQAGLRALPRDSVRHLEGKLWELRMTGRDGISRAIYVTASGQRVVILRAFVKKSQKTPLHEIEIARQRARDVT